MMRILGVKRGDTDLLQKMLSSRRCYSVKFELEIRVQSYAWSSNSVY